MDIEYYLNFINSRKISYIFGGAGTGKTTLITNLCKRIDNAVILSFTNNSVNILKSYELDNTNIIQTIHSALEIYTTIDESYKDISVSNIKCCDKHVTNAELLGDVVLYDDMFKCNADKLLLTDKFKDVVILIDECSLITHELIYLIEKLPSMHIVYVGDKYQLPPVDAEMCRVCKKKKCTFNIFNRGPSHVSDIIELTENYRNSNHIIKIIKNFMTKNSLYLNPINFKDIIHKGVKLDSPILCYKNSSVDYINKLITKNKPYPTENDPIHFLSGSSNAIVGKVYIVDTFSINNILDKLFGEFTVYVIKTKCGCEMYSAVDQDAFRERLIIILKHLDSTYTKPDLASKRRKIIFGYRFYVNPWSFAAAITAHKAQGSSFENSYIYISDFHKADKTLKRSLLYTSLSRSKNDAFNIVIPSRWVLS